MEIIEAQWVLPVEPWTVIENGAVAVEDGRIADVGPAAEVRAGRKLFAEANCQSCHAGTNFTVSRKDFTSPPAAAEVSTERTGTFIGNPVGAQQLARFLRDIGSFNIGVAGGNNPLQHNIGAAEKAAPAVNLVNGALTAAAAQDALGFDYNSDGKGNGYNVPSLVGIGLLPPYYHNGACESLACVVGNPKHRTVNGTRPDGLVSPADQEKVVAFLESIDRFAPLPDGTLVNFFTLLTINGNAAITNARLALVRSRDKGATWSAPIIVADLRAVGAFDPDSGQAVRDGSIVPPLAAGQALPAGEVQRDASPVVFREHVGGEDAGAFVRDQRRGRAPPGIAADAHDLRDALDQGHFDLLAGAVALRCAATTTPCPGSR